MYNYILKPYLKFIAEEEGFAIELLQGDDDRILVDYQTVEEIKRQSNQYWASEINILNCIRSAKWQLEDGRIVCCPKYPVRQGRYTLNPDTCVIYKKIAWKQGILHFDDVLYFSYKLVIKYPFIPQIIAKEFPYFFIDEFQDSNPIQVNILKEIATHGTVIGVIGDRAQSIYGFLGADVTQFNNFNIPNLQDYEIKGNRRSTRKIIELLNVLRPDFQQECLTDEEGDLPLLLVGDKIACYCECERICGKGMVHTLAFRNTEANIMKRMENVVIVDQQLLNNIEDSNLYRKESVKAFVKAIEYARDGNFRDALAVLEKMGYEPRRVIGMLKVLLDNYDTYESDSLIRFCTYINTEFGLGLADFSKGNPKLFYEGHTYRELAMCISNPNCTGIHRIVHKSKGDEFDNVFLVLSDEKPIGMFLSPNLNVNEVQRVYYVAMSRAKKRLFITVPTLSKSLENNLMERKIPVQINRM